MFSRLLLISCLTGVIAWAVFQEIRSSRQFEQLRREKEALRVLHEAMEVRLAQAEARLKTLPEAGTPLPVALANASSAQAIARIAAVEAKLANLTNAVAQSIGIGPRTAVGSGRIPGGNSFNGGVASQFAGELGWPPDSGEQTNAPAKRGWGPEQAVGPPDTHQAGDISTAWASREPDGGLEWLSVAFERNVPVAEVRIRETYNPGAISKVTAIVNGREVVLWSGTEDVGPAPRDFVVPGMAGVSAQNIIVHLDSNRIQGWNEIDAVELVGTDGSRQWAVSAIASSTYAERSSNALPAQVSPNRL